MNNKADLFISNLLGGDFKELLGSALSKSEVYKPGTRTVTDTNDLFQGLQIVPKALLSLLIRELSPMEIGESKEVRIPIENTVIQVTKHERDSFSGQVIQNNLKISDFMHRSIPGLGLVLLTVLELYDLEKLDHEPKSEHSIEQTVQKLVDERINLHSLINKVVDGKLMQRDAVQQLFMAKLNQLSQEHKQIKEEHKDIIQDHKEIQQKQEEPKKPEIEIPLVLKKKRPLEEFVENRKKKLQKKEFSIQMVKGEIVNCPDCNGQIFSDSGVSACMCYGNDMGRKVYLKKTEDGVKVSFPKSWSQDNIEMLLEVLRGKNG